MAHYAFLNADNEVVEVITGKDESEAAPEGYADWEEYCPFIIISCTK